MNKLHCDVCGRALCAGKETKVLGMLDFENSLKTPSFMRWKSDKSSWNA
jgi:hypothetical protein